MYLTLNITIPENLTAAVDDTARIPEHTCGPDCDCPVALARTQQAIDADRALNGDAPRPLGDRIRGMQYARPDHAWFEQVADDADELLHLLHQQRGRAGAAEQRVNQLQTQAYQVPGGNMPMPIATNIDTARKIMLERTMAHTFNMLERVRLLPTDHEYVVEPMVDGGKVMIWAGNLKFEAEITGLLDTPKNGYRVVVTDDATPDGNPAEQLTDDLDDVRAWLTGWAAAATYAQPAH